MTTGDKFKRDAVRRRLTPFQKDVGYVGILVFSGLLFVMSLLSAYDSGNILLGIFAVVFGGFTVLMVFTLTAEKSDGT